MVQPKASSSKLAAERALRLNMQICYLLRWLRRSGVVRQQNRGTRRILVEKAKARKVNHKRRLSTEINTLWNNTVEGTLIVGTVVK